MASLLILDGDSAGLDNVGNVSSRFTFVAGFVITTGAAACSSFSGSVDVSTGDQTGDPTNPATKQVDGITTTDDSGTPPPSYDSGTVIEVDGGGTSSDGGGGTNDGGPAMDAGGPTNLVTNGDFEDGNCTSWTKNSATCSAVTVAHSGTYGARLCTSAGGSSVFESIPVGGLPVGTTFDFTVWIRATDSGTTTAGASCKLEVFDKTDSISLGGPLEEPIGMPNSTWQPCQVSITLTAAQVATGAKLRPVVIEGAMGCMLADDAVLTKR